MRCICGIVIAIPVVLVGMSHAPPNERDYTQCEHDLVQIWRWAAHLDRDNINVRGHENIIQKMLARQVDADRRATYPPKYTRYFKLRDIASLLKTGIVHPTSHTNMLPAGDTKTHIEDVPLPLLDSDTEAIKKNLKLSACVDFNAYELQLHPESAPFIVNHELAHVLQMCNRAAMLIEVIQQHKACRANEADLSTASLCDNQYISRGTFIGSKMLHPEKAYIWHEVLRREVSYASHVIKKQDRQQPLMNAEKAYIIPPPEYNIETKRYTCMPLLHIYHYPKSNTVSGGIAAYDETDADLRALQFTTSPYARRHFAYMMLATTPHMRLKHMQQGYLISSMIYGARLFQWKIT